MLLKAYLKKRKISLRKFSEMMGTSHVYLCHIISGRRKVGLVNAKKIHALTHGRVSLLEILYPEDYQTESDPTKLKKKRAI